MSDRPHTITDFRRLPAAKRGGRSAAEAKAMHDARRANPPLPAAANNRFGDRAAADRDRRSVRTSVTLGTAAWTLVSTSAANPRLREWSLGQRAAPWRYRQREREQGQQKRIMAAAVRERLVVCLAAAKRAGHCEAGTINWGARHGFSPNGHHTPDQLLAVALRRHQTEMRQGFSVLADHGR